MESPGNRGFFFEPRPRLAVRVQVRVHSVWFQTTRRLDGIHPGQALPQLPARASMDDVRGRARGLHVHGRADVPRRHPRRREAAPRAVGRNRKNAAARAQSIAVAEDEGTFEPIRNIRFDEWADQWLAGLKNKPSTIDSYRHTIRYAKLALGPSTVRRLTVEQREGVPSCLRGVAARQEARARDERLDAGEASARARGLPRVGGQLRLRGDEPCAEAPGPARSLERSEEEAAYFTNDELPRLFAELAERGVYRIACLLRSRPGCGWARCRRSRGATSTSSTP